MFNRRKKFRRDKNKALLDAFFETEYEWKNLQAIVESSIEPKIESFYLLELLEARYIFLLKEAKERNLNALRY
ncbi:MAG TPA: YaaL family protein [Pseudogracilibacillus sp.]|nr:YaaL family protein [Pseudogracilibacillus sp.]